MFKRATGLTAMVAAFLTLLLAGTVERADAQVTMTAEDWSFTFTGNVNAFWVFESASEDGEVTSPFALVGTDSQSSAVRTGLLPAFAQFEANGTEGGLDLGVHFGFAPQIQTPGSHDNFGNGTQAGAQIDMREVYLTVGGDFGQILAGRAIGVFQRQNILTDMTLFGVGATGGNVDPGGTTLGRIGFGYVYPNFNAQIAYSTPSDNPAQFTVALFDPDAHNGFDETVLPRLESEFTWSSDDFMFWAGGLLQTQKDTDLEESSTSTGVTGGLQYSGDIFSLTGSAYYGSGIGTTLMFLGARSAAAGSTELRPSFGYIGQATVTPAGSDLTLGLSWGQSTIENADDEPEFETTNSSITGGLYVQATESLKVVGEGSYTWADDGVDVTEKNNSVVLAGGLMLFF